MAIDLSTPEGRSSYLNEKLSDLIEGVDSTYGDLIFDELLKRIDSTIKDFDEEMAVIFDELKSNEKKRQSVLLKLRKSSSSDQIDEKDQQKKDWEKKLLELYGRNKETNASQDITDKNKEEDKK